jgi:hypothetical protein
MLIASTKIFLHTRGKIIMRTLAIDETKNISGGYTSEAMLAVGAVAIAAIIVGASSSYSYPYSYSYSYGNGCYTTTQGVTKSYDVSTPTYDGYGRLLGYKIDTYSYVEQVPVTVC